MLSGKNILLISPQPWGGLFVSKNHYAVELARRGNNVYFLCPIPLIVNQSPRIRLRSVPGHENLFIVEHKIWFPFQIKFYVPFLFHLLMFFHSKRILKAIKNQIDVVWSFDLGNYFPFRFFSDNVLKIFHPVDEPLNQAALDSAEGSHIILSVTNSILHKYDDNSAVKFLIGHGLSDIFLAPALKGETKLVSNRHRIGFSGNLRRQDIDRKILMRIMVDNPELLFECFGSFNILAGSGEKNDELTDKFINDLRELPNVRLHGFYPPAQLAEAYQGMDAFLICYDVRKDQSRGTNYHKILEFLSTGKVVISNRVEAYSGRPDLVQMVSGQSNDDLPDLFKSILNSLDFHNSTEMKLKRIEFARSNTYRNQVNRIDEILSNHFASFING